MVFFTNSLLIATDFLSLLPEIPDQNVVVKNVHLAVALDIRLISASRVAEIPDQNIIVKDVNISIVVQISLNSRSQLVKCRTNRGNAVGVTIRISRMYRCSLAHIPRHREI